MKITVEPVGWVRTTRQDLSDDYWGGVISTIELDGSRFNADALAGLETFSHIEVIYCFNKVPLDKVVTGAGHPRENPNWPIVGIFSQRKKNRPNRLGLSICRIIAVNGTKLTVEVEGLDAINGTPVIDIKPHMKEFAPRGEVKQPRWSNEIMTNYFAEPSGSAPQTVDVSQNISSNLFSGDVLRKIAEVSDIYAERCGIKRDRDWYLLKLQEEIGELVNAHLIRTSRSRRKLADQEAILKLSDEAADVFAQFMLFVKNEGIDLNGALERKWFAWLKGEEL